MASTFHRPARTYPERLPSGEMVIVSPTPLASPQGGAASWVQLLLPIVGSASSLVFYLSYPQKSPLLLIGVGAMLVASVGGGLSLRVFQRRQFKQQAKRYRDKYGRYLADLTTRLNDISQRQRASDMRVSPPLDHLEAVIQRRTALWERRHNDEDFLQVRLGTGVVPLASKVRVDLGSNPLADFDPELLAKAQALVARYEHLDDAPIVLRLREMSTLTLNGKPSIIHGLARALLCQAATFHAPDDLRIFVACSREDANEWSWLKWLPHTRRLRQTLPDQLRGDEALCLMADNGEDAHDILMSQIAPEIAQRRKLSERDGKSTTTRQPHIICVLDGYAPRSPIAHLPLIEEIMRDGNALNITTICLVHDRGNEPSYVQARLEVDEGGWLTFTETAFGGQRLEFITPDSAPLDLCERVSRALAPLSLSEENAQGDLSRDVRLLPLLHYANSAQVEPSRSWRARERSELLRVPIGMGVDGSPLILDIKESAEDGMGPHGLIIGATGSGKSELLRTIVSSLAITHDPETLNFVLADFKGGASFADLAALPHAAGLITNLQSDLALVDRMRAALLGEQERRQRMLRESGNLDNIRQYQIKRQQNPAMKPLPYLMIIVDEFAELLSQRPDFLDLFVGIGRVGRSLGMHLLLATQRLGEGRIQGLEGHLRYRICLRTFSAAESTAVLGTPDAFYLPAYPGIGYFKVDTTLYRQFKSAVISLPSSGILSTDSQPRIREFTAMGRLVERTKGNSSVGVPPKTDEPRTEMDEVITQLRRPSSTAPLEVHQVWLPPLSDRLTLGEVLATQDRPINDQPFGALRIPLGLVDLPIEQRQPPFILDFSGVGGHLAIVGAPQSGKSTALQTMMAALIATHSPREVQLYAIDLGGGSLRGLEDAPQVGAVCGKGERDKIRRLIRQMRSIIEDREILFRQQHIDSIATFRALRREGKLNEAPFGDAFLIIDDLGQLHSDIEGSDAEIMDIASTGLAYGVHLILATNRWADIRAKLRDTIGTRLELRLNDPMESDIGKAAAITLAQSKPGRGIMKGGNLFQVALPLFTDGLTSAAQGTAALIAEARRSWSSSAPPLQMLPTLLTADDPRLRDAGHPGVIVGIEEFRLEPVAIDLSTVGPHFLIFGDGESGKTNLIRAWAHALSAKYTPEQMQFTVIDYRRTLLDIIGDPHLLSYAATPLMLKDSIDKLKAVIEPRMLSSTNLTIEELRKPRTWSGARQVLFIDDYEGIITPSGNPLAPLLDAIAQARDIGFHVILVRRVGGTSRTAFESVFQRIKEMGSPGLILSGDAQEGPLLGTQRASILPAGRGYLVQRNTRTMLIQTPLIRL